ncbi:MAG: HAD-IC family P-type ATPase [Nanoarchaeota archaeon]|nr:HAD-IC family P-type ATPase [Nanoarchaeota archaeon]
MKQYYQEGVESVFSELSTSKKGLSIKEVEKRIKHYGNNEIKSEKRDSIYKIFLRQFRSFVIWVLAATALISLFLSHNIEFLIIVMIIIFILLLSFFMEYKASRDIDALIKLTPKRSTVIRNGKKIEVSSVELVPGDILLLKRGDAVGADARMIECDGLKVDESTLTGESVSVNKSSAALIGDKSLAEQENIVFAGTHITNGHCMAVIVGTGENTEFGNVSKLIKGIKHETTPLQKRLDKLTKQIAVFAVILSIISFFVGLLHGVKWGDMLIFSMAIIVSGIPESLPTVVAVTLASGVKKMAKENAIIKRIPAVETLGTCSVICTDKTGTLTQNKMVIENIFTSDTEVNVTGEGYNPKGLFFKEKDVIDVMKHKTISRILEIGVLCNNSDLKKDKHDWIVDGEPVEGALIVLAKKAGFEKWEYQNKFLRKTEHPFDSERKLMSTVHTYRGKHFVHSKGAPEMLLKKAHYYLHNGKILPLDKKTKDRFLEKNNQYGSKGLSVLGLAFKEHSGSHNIKNVENKLVFVGLVSIRDPPHSNVKESIKECKEAGIKVVMITGDNEITAKAIASELGIFTEKNTLLTGAQLDKLTDADFEKIIDNVTVYARTTPSQKLRIVETFQRVGHIVAMTGDGVNDSPALKKADIGIAMGKSGTEVAKASSELILKDDNFTTIVKAVESGRTIYDNIRKFIYYLLVGSLSEVLLILLAVIVGVSLPLTALMILFINLVTSEFPAMGLSVEKASKQIMKQRPRDPKEGILSDFVIMRILGTTPIIILGVLSLYIWEMFVSGNLAKAQTIVFATIIMFELFHAFNAKSWNSSIINKRLFSNKYVIYGVLLAFILTITVIYLPSLQNIFGTVALNAFDWVLITIVSSSIIVFVELKKFVLRIEMKERKKVEIYPTRG